MEYPPTRMQNHLSSHLAFPPTTAKPAMSETSPARPPPAKRVKLDEPTPASVPALVPTPAQTQTFSQIDLERAVGITEYIDAGLKGWRGILKQRYVVGGGNW